MILKRLCYSEDLELKQREYNIASEIYHSGFKRVGKKYIGRARRNIGDKITQYQRNSLAKNIKNNRIINELDKNYESDKTLARKLVREANKRNIRVFDKNNVERAFGKDVGNKENYIMEVTNLKDRKNYREQASKLTNRNSKKVASTLGKTGKVINIGGDYDKSWASLAHEIGHDMNKDGKISGVIKKLSRFKPKEFKHDPKKSGIRNEVGSIMNSAKNKLGTAIKNSEIPRYLEERNAWKNARKLMKRNGASKAQLEQFDKERDTALRTYKSSAMNEKLSKLRSKVQIKSELYGVNGRPATSERLRKNFLYYVRKNKRQSH